MKRTLNTRFWTEAQNNSGGIFDHDAAKGVGYRICVEAIDASDAVARLERIIDSYSASYDCPCCGSRWSLWLDDSDGTDMPESYGTPLKGGWGIPSYIHYLDGTIECREP